MSDPTSADPAARRQEIAGWFARHFSPGDEAIHPLYSALCDSGASGGPLVELLLGAPPTQARPTLVLAAVHDLALSDPDGPIGRHFPSASWWAERGRSATSPPADPPPLGQPDPVGSSVVAEILEALTARKADLLGTLAMRKTQTNEVGRCGPLHLAVAAATDGRPCALIDLGCSAGLNLSLDRYRIDIELADGSTTTLGHEGSPVVISTELLGGSPDLRPVDVAWRSGIDLEPPTLAEAADLRWLLACQWPDDLPRFERSRRAMGLRLEEADPPPIHAGDAVDLIEAVADTAPAELPLVITMSWVATYLEPDRQAELAAAVRRIASSRPTSWIWMEHPRLVPGLDPPAAAKRIPGASLLALESSSRPAVAIGQCHPHGRWIDLDG